MKFLPGNDGCNTVLEQAFRPACNQNGSCPVRQGRYFRGQFLFCHGAIFGRDARKGKYFLFRKKFEGDSEADPSGLCTALVPPGHSPLGIPAFFPIMASFQRISC